jgi:3-deoxy-manno-octulosonate cytidylyltransferase (CMP-KDO synthetase)
MPEPQTVIIIPARYASTRYPGKPLVGLAGATGISRSLIERSWLAAQAVRGVDAVWVATDDDRIAETARRFGASVVMTSPACANGTERCADALDRLGIAPRVAVNLQGDAPLTPPWFVEALIAAMTPGTAVATPVLRLSPAMHRRFIEDRQTGMVGGTTAVADRQGNALYFSKEVVPHTGRRYAEGEMVPVFHHVGVYAYTPAALTAYRAAGPCDLEALEGLEQLRFLWNGTPVRCVEVEDRGRAFWELNNPADVPRIEAILRSEGIA